MFLVGTLHIPEPCILRIYRDNSVKNYLKDEDDGELEKWKCQKREERCQVGGIKQPIFIKSLLDNKTHRKGEEGELWG